jgi:hypothetical protein
MLFRRNVIILSERQMPTKAKRLIRDPELRNAVKHSLLAPLCKDPTTLVIDELGLRHGAARIDIAVVNGDLHGYELKSDHDNLRRLPRQVGFYNSVLDRITLVVTEQHFTQAIQMIPSWWDVLLADNSPAGDITFRIIQAGAINPDISALAVAKLLWRDEALHLLEIHRGADGVRSKPRRFIYGRLVELLDLPQLRASVRDQLRARKDWRFGEPQM